MKRTIDIYREAYRHHGRSPASLLIPKGRQVERFASLTRPIRGTGFSILDFGCGFGDLKSYLGTRFHDFRYTGVDIVPEFVRECIASYGPDADFRQIDAYLDVQDEYDYIIVSGVFNTLFHETRGDHAREVRAMLSHLFGRTRRVLAFDFMTDRVDYQQPEAYHENPLRIYEFACSQLSPRLVLDQSYLPYEFSLVVHKDQQIQRPENVYRDV